MPVGFLLKAVQGCDFDTDEAYKSPEHAAFIKNMCLDLNENSSFPSGTSGEEGDNMGVFTPIEDTEVLCPIQLPEGNNYCIGYHEAKETNEGYVFVWNSLSNHLIYVIDGYTGQCRIVWKTPCLNFQLTPQYFISLGRCVLFTSRYYNKAIGTTELRKFLIFTDGYNAMRFICVEDAIATVGFTSPFFTNRYPVCDLLSLEVMTPNACIQITPVARDSADKRDNLISNKAVQFRLKFIDVWGRQTEHGIISDQWYSTLSACITEAAGQARCVDLSFEAGPDTIAKIQIEFRYTNANDPGTTVATDWFLYETLDKYDLTNSRLQWWERPINPDLNYDAVTNRITYRFCGDRGTTALPVTETNRNYNPIAQRAQSIFAANQSLGTAGHIKGNPPLDKSTLLDISYGTTPPVAGTQCTAKTRSITIYAYLRCLVEDSVSHFRQEGSDVVYGKDSTSILKEFDQVLPAGQTGVIGYFAGTDEYAFSKQVMYDGNTKKVTEIGYSNSADDYVKPNTLILQQWTFPLTSSGKKIFRIAHATASPHDHYQTTSFPIMGTVKFSDLNAWLHRDKFEIVIDDCDGDYDSIQAGEIIMMADLTSTPHLVRRITNVCSGYLYEDEINKFPIEKAVVEAPTADVQFPAYTDHNGYYFSVSRTREYRVTLKSIKNCQYTVVAQSSITHDAPGSRFRYEKLYMYKLTNPYPPGDRIPIKGRIVLCDNPTVGVSGMLVMLTGGGTAITDENGYYTIIAHDRGRGSNYTRTDQIMFAQKGLCYIGRCDNACSSCFDNILFTAPPCTGSERPFAVPNLTVKPRETGLRGPQNGGHYELGIVAYYGLGQPTFVQRLTTHAVDIPSIIETGVFGFSQITYNIDRNITFPAGVRYFTFAISKNLAFDDSLEWPIEKVQFVDNTGKVNTVTPTQIRLYYSGLAEYNLQNNEATNTVWEVLTEDQAPVIGDRVEFLQNGDGKLFTKKISAQVKYDKAGQYLAVNYNEDLKDLSDGALIKLIRPHVNTNAHFFFELCRVIKVTDGKVAAADLTGTLNYWDSYMVNRQIPVPYYFINQTTKLQEKDPERSQLKTFSYPFEHHSPSDFWGDHAANRGRVYAENPYENQAVRPMEFSLSAALSNDDILNGLNYFDDGLTTQFDEQEWGGVTCVISDVSRLAVICQQKTFMIPFDDNTVRVGKDNTLSVNPINSRLGRPSNNSTSRFGCHPEDINTIREHMGLVMFLDRSEAALVALDGDGQDVSNQGFRGWMKDKIKFMVQHNQQPFAYLKYFHATFDPKRKQYLLTCFTISRRGEESFNPDYVNKLRQTSLLANETIGYNPWEKSLKLMYGFTPEYYGALTGERYDNQLFSFRKGVCWTHHRRAQPAITSYLTFYGEVCEAVYEPVCNAEPNAVKRYMWTEVLCRDVQFFIDQVITESGQRSRLLKTWWEKREEFWTADFKMSTTSVQDPNVPVLKDQLKLILEGDPLTGKWIRPRYVYVPDTQGRYFEFDGVHIFLFVAQKSGITPTGERFTQAR